MKHIKEKSFEIKYLSDDKNACCFLNVEVLLVTVTETIIAIALKIL